MSGERLLCKDCWTPHDASSVRARCKLCDAKHGYEWRQPLRKIGQENDEGELVCKKHPTEPLDVFCNNPECRKQLSLRAMIDGSGVVAIVGDSGCGKTTFLYVLRRSLGPGRDAAVQIRQTFGNSDEQLKATAKGDRSEVWPTPRGGPTLRNYAWELVSSSSMSEERWVVAFHDAAGGTWRSLETLPASERLVFLRFLDLMGSSIFVIDGARLAADDATGTYDEPVQEAIRNELAIMDALTRRLRAKNERVRTAVVISKSDLLWSRPGCEIFRQDNGATRAEIAAQVQRLLSMSGRGPLLKAISATPGEVDYFAVSALGEGAAGGNIDNARPERLVEPVLNVIGVDPPPLHT